MREAREAEYESNPFYLKGDARQRPDKLNATGKKLSTGDSVDSVGSKAVPEVLPIDLQSPLEIPGELNR